MTVNEAPSSSVQAVGVAFAVLEALSQTPEAVGTSVLARQLGETKARVHRHLMTLRAPWASSRRTAPPMAIAWAGKATSWACP